MAWKSFTPEELTALRRNPYVKSATTHMVRFTIAFKAEFWKQYNDDGLPPAQIIRSMGFDTEILGETRIRGIVLHIKEQAASGADFTDIRQVHAADSNLPPSKVLLHMQHEVAYMKQELEFIKKIILADREAKRKCSSKPNRMSSSESSEK